MANFQVTPPVIVRTDSSSHDTSHSKSKRPLVSLYIAATLALFVGLVACYIWTYAKSGPRVRAIPERAASTNPTSPSSVVFSTFSHVSLVHFSWKAILPVSLIAAVALFAILVAIKCSQVDADLEISVVTLAPEKSFYETYKRFIFTLALLLLSAVVAFLVFACRNSTVAGSSSVRGYLGTHAESVSNENKNTSPHYDTQQPLKIATTDTLFIATLRSTLHRFQQALLAKDQIIREIPIALPFDTAYFTNVSEGLELGMASNKVHSVNAGIEEGCLEEWLCINMSRLRTDGPFLVIHGTEIMFAGSSANHLYFDDSSLSYLQQNWQDENIMELTANIECLIDQIGNISPVQQLLGVVTWKAINPRVVSTDTPATAKLRDSLYAFHEAVVTHQLAILKLAPEPATDNRVDCHYLYVEGSGFSKLVFIDRSNPNSGFLQWVYNNILLLKAHGPMITVRQKVVQLNPAPKMGTIIDESSLELLGATWSESEIQAVADYINEQIKCISELK